MRYLKQVSTGKILTTMSDPKAKKVPLPNPKEGDFYYDNGHNTANKKPDYRKFIAGKWVDTNSLMMKQDYIDRGIPDSDMEEGMDTGTVVARAIRDSISLEDYKEKEIENQKQIGQSIFKKYKDDFNNSNTVISVKRTLMKNYFINTVQPNINHSSNTTKSKIDTAITELDWNSV